MIVKESIRVTASYRRLQFITNKRFVDRVELTELLKISRKIPNDCPVKKVDKILKASIAIAAGYVHETPSSGRRLGKKRLISFGHATGDSIMVACVDRIAVRPGHDIEEVGYHTLQRLTRDLICLGVSEILTIAPLADIELFASCNYGNDPQNATLMSLPVESFKHGQLALSTSEPPLFKNIYPI